MANKGFDLDFQKMFDSVGKYFNGLAMDMQIAWAMLGLGIILIVVGIVML